MEMQGAEAEKKDSSSDLYDETLCENLTES